MVCQHPCKLLLTYINSIVFITFLQAIWLMEKIIVIIIIIIIIQKVHKYYGL